MYLHIVWLLYVHMYVFMKFQFIRCSALNKTIFNSNDNNNGGFDFPKRQKMKIYVGCVTVNVAFVINQFSLHFVIVCNLPLRRECHTHKHTRTTITTHVHTFQVFVKQVGELFMCFGVAFVVVFVVLLPF